MVNGGNIIRVSITSQNIHCAFDIYGKSAAALRGKTTFKKAGRSEEHRTDQVSYTDVIKVREQAYLVSIVVRQISTETERRQRILDRPSMCS